MMSKLLFYLVMTGLTTVYCERSTTNRYKPVIWSKYFFQGKPVLFGIVRENETIVHLDPALTAHDKDSEGTGQFICSYQVNRHNHYFRPSSFPFQVVVVDRLIGQAEIRVKTGTKLDVSKRAYYKFTVNARDCGSPVKVSGKAYVLVKVVAANDSVNFVKESYTVLVQEGRIQESIFKLLPTDVARMVDFASICDYHMLTTDVPFRITPEGVFQNIEPLDFLKNREYFIGVVAQNCQGEHSKPIFIKVIVTQRDQPAPTSPQAMLPSGHLALNDEPTSEEVTESHASGSRLKIITTTLVITMCTVAVIVIVLLVVVRNRKFTRSQYSDVYYEEDESELEWDYSVLEASSPNCKL